MQLMILVQQPDKINAGKYKELLRNSFPLNQSMSYDYQGLINGIKLLYPNRDLIINLSIYV